MRSLLYKASVTEMDAAIGDVLQRLDHHDIADNTLVIFFSDNGGSGGADNDPLRGRKAQLWEGGVRVPCIVRWPGRVPAGRVSNEFLTALEILPTICAAVGVSPPPEIVLDGFDMLPVLDGQVNSPRNEMFWQRQADRAARVGDWKWVDAAHGRGLFHLAEDLSEQHDLSRQHPQKLSELRLAFDRWQQEMASAEPRGPFRNF